MRVLDTGLEIIELAGSPDTSLVVSPWDLPGGPTDNTIVAGREYEVIIPVALSLFEYECMRYDELGCVWAHVLEHPWYYSISFALDNEPFTYIHHGTFNVMWPCNPTFSKCWWQFRLPLKVDTLGEHTVYYEFQVFAKYTEFISTYQTHFIGELSRVTDKRVVVVGEGPTCKFSFSPSSGRVPLTVSFTDKSVSTAGITSRQWFFGDGSGSYEKNPTHTYGIPGDFLVILSVTDDYGVSACEANIMVLPADGNGNGTGDSNWELWAAMGSGIALVGVGIIILEGG